MNEEQFTNASIDIFRLAEQHDVTAELHHHLSGGGKAFDFLQERDLLPATAEAIKSVQRSGASVLDDAGGSTEDKISATQDEMLRQRQELLRRSQHTIKRL